MKKENLRAKERKGTKGDIIRAPCVICFVRFVDYAVTQTNTHSDPSVSDGLPPQSV